MPRYIDADALIDNIHRVFCNGCNNYNGVRCRACGTDDAISMLDSAPTANVAPRSEVSREIFEQIHREIAEAIKSNVRAIDERQEKYNIYEDDFIHRCYGKIDALRGIDGFITELKEKCVKEDPNADT